MKFFKFYNGTYQNTEFGSARFDKEVLISNFYIGISSISNYIFSKNCTDLRDFNFSSEQSQVLMVLGESKPTK